MIKKLIPDYYYNSIKDIPYTKLYSEGYRLILTDLDNTLISYLEKEPTEALFTWKRAVEEIGFEIILVSNSRKDRVRHFASILGLKYVKFAKKPLKFGLKKALKKASKSYSIHEVFEIGDQIMTDVYGSKRMGLMTILVKAIDHKTEVLPTKINRKLEEHFLKKIKKKYPERYEHSLKQYVEEKNDSKKM